MRSSPSTAFADWLRRDPPPMLDGLSKASPLTLLYPGAFSLNPQRRRSAHKRGPKGSEDRAPALGAANVSAFDSAACSAGVPLQAGGRCALLWAGAGPNLGGDGARVEGR